MIEKTKILQVGGSSTFGGIETFQLLMLRAINHNLFSMDFIVNNKYIKLPYEKEIINNGGKVYYIPSRKQNYLKRIKILRLILKKNYYDVIHIHEGSLADDLFLKEALKANIKIVILHSHSSGNFTNSVINGILHYYNKVKYANSKIIRIACSENAGKWMHCNLFKSNNFIVIKNGINLEKFAYSEKYRLEIREELNIGKQDYVIGNISRFSPEKNFNFILRIFKEILKKCDNAKLLLVGDGSLKKEIIHKVNELRLTKNVIFPGFRQDTYKLLSAMDAYVFPSVSEGLPFSIVESQISGLKTIISNNITNEVCFTQNVYKLGIMPSDIELWVDALFKYSKGYCRKSCVFEAEKAGFSIQKTIKVMEKIYSNNYEFK